MAVQALRKRRYQEAEQLFSKLVASPGTAAEGYYGLGIVKLNGQKLPEAEELFLAAIRMDEQHANAVYYLGIVREKKGATADALDLYQRACKLNSKHRKAREAIVRLSQETPNSRPTPPDEADTSGRRTKRRLSDLDIPDSQEDLQYYAERKAAKERTDWWIENWYKYPVGYVIAVGVTLIFFLGILFFIGANVITGRNEGILNMED